MPKHEQKVVIEYVEAKLIKWGKQLARRPVENKDGKKNHTPTYPIFLGPVTRNTEIFFKVFHLMYAKGSIFMQSSNENNIFCYIVSHEPFLKK
jgi:hypothetical protein